MSAVVLFSDGPLSEVPLYAGVSDQSAYNSEVCHSIILAQHKRGHVASGISCLL